MSYKRLLLLGILFVFLSSCSNVILVINNNYKELKATYLIKTNLIGTFAPRYMKLTIHYPEHSEEHFDTFLLHINPPWRDKKLTNARVFLSQNTLFDIAGLRIGRSTQDVHLYLDHAEDESLIPFYESPEDSHFNIDQAMSRVGVALIQRQYETNGNIEPVTDHCTTFIIGDYLLLTNNHCISSKEECRHSTFAFWERTKEDANQSPSILEFPCASVVATSGTYDYSVLQSYIDLSYRTGNLTLLKGQFRFIKNTPVWILTRNPMEKMAVKLCFVGKKEKIIFIKMKSQRDIDWEVRFGSYDMPGCNLVHSDSGSPVLNAHGNVIGLVIGRYKGGASFMPISNVIKDNMDLFVEREVTFSE
jgi:hypothetical protein